MVKIELGKRDFVWIGLIVVLLGVGFGYAYSTGSGGVPSVMGHSEGEIELGIKTRDFSYGGRGEPAPRDTEISTSDWPNAFVVFRGASQYDSDRSIWLELENIDNTWHVAIKDDLTRRGVTVYYTLVYWK